MFRSFASRLGLKRLERTTRGQLLSVEEQAITGRVLVNGKDGASSVSVQVNGVAAPVKVTFEPSTSTKHPNFYEFRAEFASRAAFSAGDSVTVAYGASKAQLAGSPWCIRQEAKNDFEYAFLHYFLVVVEFWNEFPS